MRLSTHTALACLIALVGACSVVGKSDVAHAPYSTLASDSNQQIEIRRYESLVLVSTAMSDEDNDAAFKRLFDYISGANQGSREIAMTAPVLMNQTTATSSNIKVDAAPTFMRSTQGQGVMAFVMPADFTVQDTPQPASDEVWITPLEQVTLAAIQFSGTLSDENIKEHTDKLRSWLQSEGYTVLSQPITAAYNGPMTLPPMRTNEVLIEVAPSRE